MRMLFVAFSEFIMVNLSSSFTLVLTTHFPDSCMYLSSFPFFQQFENEINSNNTMNTVLLVSILLFLTTNCRI